MIAILLTERTDIVLHSKLSVNYEIVPRTEVDPRINCCNLTKSYKFSRKF